MPRRGISQAEPPTGPQNEPYIRDSAFLWCGGFCVALFVQCVGFLRRVVRGVGEVLALLVLCFVCCRRLLLAPAFFFCQSGHLIVWKLSMDHAFLSPISGLLSPPEHQFRPSSKIWRLWWMPGLEAHTHTHHCSLCPLQAKRPVPSRTSPCTPSLRSSFLWS